MSQKAWSMVKKYFEKRKGNIPTYKTCDHIEIELCSLFCEMAEQKIIDEKTWEQDHLVNVKFEEVFVVYLSEWLYNLLEEPFMQDKDVQEDKINFCLLPHYYYDLKPIEKLKYIPVSYQELDCCVNCKHVFVKQEYDDGEEYFCHLDGSERPLCGSVAMGESICLGDESEYVKASHKWEKWSQEREVVAWGKCSNYEKREK